jgi:pSer/pThr/pTyr-binding forkhead associated (FHA) protein
MAAVYCNKCGHRNATGSNFCSSCGALLEPESQDHSTITFRALTESESPGEEVSIDLDRIPSEVGMLVVKRGPQVGSRYALDRPLTTAGRHPESDIFLDDITVSRRHVEIEQVGDSYVVRDAGSLNGTYLNRERVTEATLANGDEVQIGAFKLVFFQGPPDADDDTPS